MNYYPYFRGKQFELICIRENAELISDRGFTPIIEPVRDSPVGLLRAVDALKSESANFLIVANPTVGHHADELPQEFIGDVNRAVADYDNGGWLYQIRDSSDLELLESWLNGAGNLALLHHGNVPAKELIAVLDKFPGHNGVHVFSDNCTTRYRSLFQNGAKIILEDGFNKTRNKDYPDVELFSELPVTFSELNADGFGDYLIVGKDFSEGGGAAYAVAIHITYVDPEEDGVVYVRHFVSDTNDTPTDPAGKFREALLKLARFIEGPDSKITRTKAIEEFLKLHEFGHYPGLGYVKKLSMQHHLEIIG